MLIKPLLRVLAASAVALGPSSVALGQDLPAQEPSASVAPAAPAESNAVVFSPEMKAPAPLLPAEDIPVAEQLRKLIEGELSRHVTREADRAGVEAFYRNRNFAPLWISKGAPLPRAKEAIAYLQRVAADGLDPADYPKPRYADTSAYRAAVDELLLTNSLLTFARHASTGRVAFTRVSGSIYFDLKHPDPAAVLAKLSNADDIRMALDSFHPQHPAYKALKAELAAARGLAGGADKPVRIPDGPLLRPGAEDERVPLLRQRLKLADNTTLTYGDDLVQAVRAFQEDNGLRPDGIVGPSTINRLNGETREGQVDTIIANMERWRWLPRDLGESYVIVNVPDYTLKVVDRGRTVWSTRIVVGKPGTQATPLFAETMKFITVNPTWNVPPSIIRNEYLPALQRDPNALARIGLQVTRNADGSLRVYQPPGNRNALGRLRFNFPNRFLVFQHDTPDKHLFDKDERAFSHGCMRVQSPAKYAEVLLSISQPQQGYTAERIERLYGESERSIKFEKPIPVYVTYQTMFANESGEMQTRRDIYGHDKTIASILRDDRAVADVPVARDYYSSSKPVMASVPQRESFREPSRDSFREPFGGFEFPFFSRQRHRDRHTSNW